MERTTCCFAEQTAMIRSARPLAVDTVVWTLTFRVIDGTDHYFDMLLLLHDQTTIIRSARPVAAAVFWTLTSRAINRTHHLMLLLCRQQ